jgi:phage shock protein C
MNMGNTNQFNQPPHPPQSDPRMERLASDLQANWNQYLALKDAADQIAQRQTMPEELLRVLRETAAKRLDESIAQSVKTFADSPSPTASASATGASGQSAFQQARERIKKVYRTDYDKMLAGVCGGLGEYLHLDTTIVRLFFVISALLWGIGIIAYIVLAVLLPLKLTPEEAI